MRGIKSATSILLSLGVACGAQAASFSLSGQFDADDDVALFSFTLGASSLIAIETTSYKTGGFDPALSLFTGSGVWIDPLDVPVDLVDFDYAEDIDFTNDGVANDDLDARLSVTLAAGSYTLALMQYGNEPIGPTLADGFIRDGEPDFTIDFNGCDPAAIFCDVNAQARTGDWAFDISGVDSIAPVPVPTGLPLLVTAAAALVAFRRRR